jgi:hypothetical protein
MVVCRFVPDAIMQRHKACPSVTSFTARSGTATPLRWFNFARARPAGTSLSERNMNDRPGDQKMARIKKAQHVVKQTYQ